MQLTGNITRNFLLALEAYSKWRKENKPIIIAHRKLRSVQLGEHINCQFESELTLRYQIQEMLRIEKVFEEEGIQQELDAYVPLLPNGSNWKSTMMIEYPDENERHALRALRVHPRHVRRPQGWRQRQAGLRPHQLPRAYGNCGRDARFAGWRFAVAGCGGAMIAGPRPCQNPSHAFPALPSQVAGL